MAKQEQSGGSILQFAPFQSFVDEGFWHRLSSLKLNKLGIDDSPIPVTGFYAPCSHSQVSNHFTLLSESIPSNESEQCSVPAIPRSNRNRCSVPGILYNTNTWEAYHALDKKSLLKEEAKKIWEDIHTGKAVEDSAVLSRFLLISFADLKKWSFHYLFAFPALVFDPPATVVGLKPASQWFTLEEADSVSAACNDWRNSNLTAGWRDLLRVPNAVGWELNKGRHISRVINLAKSMDPTMLAISAADLNLKLMRWRALPSLKLDKVSSTKCLLLGATLGCQVARMLMAWGIRKITLLDHGRVAMSNPVRQSLYTLDNCLNGGDFKAMAAVKSLKEIFPAVEAEGVVMAIPMPGHPVSSQEEESMLEDCRRLHELVDSHDAVFILTDTKESRWLPALLCANANKITITAALGFDSFLVMRHGPGPLNSTHDLKAEPENALSADMDSLAMADSGAERLGCYFCSDVVAPTDSTADRTLDQQCTVTRPGLAPIASSLAVELFVDILHHPNGIFADCEIADSSNSGSSEQPLGILPHQIRGGDRESEKRKRIPAPSN
ncbi:hypothetical protein GH714_012821 [Hevea brasiliensis]|uniref:Ubiquitin-like modifier-activating enzyme ATG7 n=1 Tax=Hevea brasiliensis TaxID=3981 RepID=A0A6A6LTV4_HEVBR|nr:hypothetical protein GH714_012821 [Hevea brasiliensis]